MINLLVHPLSNGTLGLPPPQGCSSGWFLSLNGWNHHPAAGSPQKLGSVVPVAPCAKPGPCPVLLQEPPQSWECLCEQVKCQKM